MLAFCFSALLSPAPFSPFAPHGQLLGKGGWQGPSSSRVRLGSSLPPSPSPSLGHSFFWCYREGEGSPCSPSTHLNRSQAKIVKSRSTAAPLNRLPSASVPFCRCSSLESGPRMGLYNSGPRNGKLSMPIQNPCFTGHRLFGEGCSCLASVDLWCVHCTTEEHQWCFALV